MLPPGTRNDRRIDADQPPVQVDQRAARIARIDRGVGLDEEAVVADADLRARQRRNDALGDGLADAERIADRDDEIADLDRIGVAKLEHRERLVAHDPEHRPDPSAGSRSTILAGTRDGRSMRP